MFGQIPKLFDRTFFIGFFLPASLMFAGILGTLNAFGYINKDVWNSGVQKSTFGVAVSIVIIWLLSIMLMAINRPVIRLLEGYGGHRNPFNILLPNRKREFERNIKSTIEKFEQIIKARRSGGIEPAPGYDFSSKLFRAATLYPEKVDNVLPTKLGNVMRAYERYAAVVYGMEAIVLWPRILMVIPEEARTRVREGEALFQFALNALIVGIISFVFYTAMMGVSLHNGNSTDLLNALKWLVIPVLSALLGWFGWSQLPGAALERGDQIKAVFDLYRAPLAQALGLTIPPTHEAERNMWQLVSRRMQWRVSTDALPGSGGTRPDGSRAPPISLDEFRKKDNTKLSDQNARQREQGSRESKEDCGKGAEEKHTTVGVQT
jgi:hypothetical protein